MAATITFDTSATTTINNTSVAWVKALGPAIGLADSALVKDTATEIIYKITQGSGTYADTYMRIRVISPYFYIQLGTGYNSGTGVLTGAGTERLMRYDPTAYRYVYVRTTLTSDNTFGLLQVCDTTNINSIDFALGYVKPTNTNLTAATIPLTAGLGYAWRSSSRYYNYRSTNTQSDFHPRYQSTDGTPNSVLVGYNNAGYVHPGTSYGTRTDYMLGMSGDVQSQSTNTGASGGTAGCVCPAIGFGLHYSEGSSQGVVPNVPIFSGGRVIGYNSNLAYCSPALVIGDRIVVSQGVEEYVKIDDSGIAVRQV
jgi:hypothetical protein